MIRIICGAEESENLLFFASSKDFFELNDMFKENTSEKINGFS